MDNDCEDCKYWKDGDCTYDGENICMSSTE